MESSRRSIFLFTHRIIRKPLRMVGSRLTTSFSVRCSGIPRSIVDERSKVLPRIVEPDRAIVQEACLVEESQIQRVRQSDIGEVGAGFPAWVI